MLTHNELVFTFGVVTSVPIPRKERNVRCFYSLFSLCKHKYQNVFTFVTAKLVSHYVVLRHIERRAF